MAPLRGWITKSCGFFLPIIETLCEKGGRVRTILIIITLTLSFHAYSAEWKKVEGIYAVTAKDMVSPVEDSHYKIQLKGQSAKDLYNSMKASPTKNDCTGAMAKNIGEMQCLYYKTNRSYECHFSINIAEQKIEYGVSC
jgi:hypothetical protein